MDKWRVFPSFLRGSIEVPSSKSHSIRALLFGLLAAGKSVCYHLLDSVDTRAMIQACRLLGAHVETFVNRVEIIGLNGKINGAEDVIQAGNSGLILRLIGGIAALSSKPIVITGDRSVRHNRLITPLLEGLAQLGAQAYSLPGGGKAPISVQGPIHSGHVVVNGEDSQPISALLIAGSFAPGPIEIFAINAGEKPWVRLTLNWLDRLGIMYRSHGYDHYRVEGNSSIEGFSYTVPGDFSSAAFPLVAAVLTRSEVTLKNLDCSDSQGDKELITVLQQMGAHIEVEEANRSIIIKKRGLLQGITIDVNDFVDAVPILAVVGCMAEGETHLVGASMARKKECDRLACIAKELRKMGGCVEEEAEGLIIHRCHLKGAVVNSCCDHRIAMALSVAALVAEGETVIEQTRCVQKTYPLFHHHMNELGACIQCL